MIILGEKQHDVPGVVTVSWLDDPKRCPRITKTNQRTRQIRSIFVHTVRGASGKLLPGGKASDQAFAYARSQVSSTRPASWDYTVSSDGHVLAQNDPVTAFSWHAMQVNPVSIGIELLQDENGDVYEATVDAACKLVVFLCETLGIQKQTCWEPANDRPYAGRIERMDPDRDGIDCVGVFGHRNVWVYRGKDDHTLVASRGPGDPGDHVFEALVRCRGFEGFAFHGKGPQDLRVWKGRQKALGFEGTDIDGVPLAKTVAKLRTAGYPNGIWVDGRVMPP